MADENDEPAASPFPWGLRPGGTPDDATPVRPPTPAPPLDQGHLVAVPDQPALPPQQPTPPPLVEPPAPSVPPATPSYDLPTQAYTPPPAAPATPSYDLPTEAYAPPAPVAPVPPPVDPAFGGAVEALAPQPVGFDGLGGPGEDAETNALDSLFGAENFVEYEPGADPTENPFQRGPGGEIAILPRLPKAPLGRTQRILVIVAGALVAAIVLVGLFFLGKRIAPSFAEQPAPVPVETADPGPVEEVLGPVAPGGYGWNALLGTECLEPFGSAWDAEFTVVDCSEPHSAQLVYRGTFDDSLLAAYPGAEELQSRVALLCASGENIDYAAANAYDDVRISASYAASEQDWIDGQRDYFCFVTRESGEPFATDVAMPDRPAPVVPVEPEPEP